MAENYTTLRISRDFHSKLAENAPKSMTFEEFLDENLELE
jgi:hypothetical protein